MASSDPIDRFRKWQKDNPEEFKRITLRAMKHYGLLREEVVRQLKNCEYWLITNGHTKKANKRAWGRFWGKWLQPKDWSKHGTVPSAFKGTSGSKRMP